MSTHKTTGLKYLSARLFQLLKLHSSEYGHMQMDTSKVLNNVKSKTQRTKQKCYLFL